MGKRPFGHAGLQQTNVNSPPCWGKGENSKMEKRGGGGMKRTEFEMGVKIAFSGIDREEG